MQDKWEYIRFPSETWKTLDQILTKEQDLFVVLTKNAEGETEKSLPLKGFVREGLELVQSMRNNANYGDEMADLVEVSFAKTLQKLA